MWRRAFRDLMLLVVLCIFVVRSPLAAPRVVVSIKPVEALVAGVMDGVGVPDVLVTNGASPHTYSLKPSDAAHLDQAAIVFWIGPAFENFLARPLESLAGKAHVVALMDAHGVVLRPARNGGVWDRHTDDAAATVAKSDGTETDGHIWLDPMNAKAMVAAITKTLIQADESNAARYSKNASALATRLDNLDADIARVVAPVKAKPFIVFHDAYQYFQARYGVNVVGSITVSPDRLPGARRVSDVKAKIASLDAACVFAEPQFEPMLIQTLVADTNAKIGVLDPEGTALTTGPELYFTLMHGIADNLAACLGG